MKKIFLSCFISLLSSATMYSQVSDNEIINYVKSEYSKGTPQDQIAANLMKRGVTKEQLERIKRDQELKNQTKRNDSTNINSYADRTRRSVNEVQFNISEYIQLDSISNTQQSLAASKIFGHDIFNNQNLSFTPLLNIPTPDNYKLGPGDEVIIDVWGASQTSLTQKISPEGSIVVDYLGPVYLNGMTVDEANVYIKNKFSSVFAGLNQEESPSHIKLTLGQIRSIQINVMGEVVAPGTYTVSSLSSIFHALYRAGGVNMIGSLRNVNLYRKGKLIQTFDIYQYILNGKINQDLRLSDGDVIIVPPYSALVNISGNVKRPMFYEMLPSESLKTLLSYSGGFNGDAYTKKIDIYRQTGLEQELYTVDAKDFGVFYMQNGDSISVKSGLKTFENRVDIKGAVYREGAYELGKKINSVKDLILAADGVKGDAFLGRAILTRQKEDFTLENIALNLNDILSDKKADILLRKNDVLYVPSKNDLKSFGDFTIHGEVAKPGVYMYADNTSIEDLLVQAGGLLESASTVRVDIARRIIDPSAVSETSTLSEQYSFSIKNGLVVDGDPGFMLMPYDEVYVRKSPGYHKQENVVIEGEVLFGGVYALNEKSERLSQLVKRAGNITNNAYVEGARLIRQRNEDEKSRLTTLMKLANRTSKDSIDVASLDKDLTYSVGIQLDKALANPGSHYDVVLRKGDRIIIPEYNNTVKIQGAVMFPNTVVYRPGKKLSYYIDQAGGYAQSAKKNKSFIVYMNGMVAKAKGSSTELVQPGSEIVVPTKEQSKKMSVGEIISLGSSVTSMASVVALLINNLSNSK